MTAASLAAAIIGQTLVVLATLPAARSILFTADIFPPSVGVYEDRDGSATKESTAQYSTLSSKVLLSGFTILGLGNALALAVLNLFASNQGDTNHVESCVNVIPWVLVLFQVLAMITRTSVTRIYTLGCYASLSCVAIFLSLFLQDGLLIIQSAGQNIEGPFVRSLRITQLIFSICCVISGFSTPRRPHVFSNGVPIDAMFTVSAFNRYNFSWATPLLTQAKKQQRLDQNDLPKMDHQTSSRELSAAWAETEHTRPLWLELVLANKWILILNNALSCLYCLVKFAPQVATYQILTLLEARTGGEQISSQVWVWIPSLLISTYIASWIEATAFWIAWSRLAIPLRSQLSALIFEKSMRRKDVKLRSKQVEEAERDPGETPAGTPEDAPKSKQTIVNLIGVDCKRVSEFVAMAWFFPGALTQLAASSAFLIVIIGWKALFAGYLAMALSIPLNIKYSKAYANSQERLMKVRDIKMEVVTETLQGIRQIKFDALEGAWLQKIGNVRAKELDQLWVVLYTDIFLAFVWIACPILLAAVALIVYAYEYGVLLPSVAFTAMSIFNNLDAALAAIPELTTNLLDAKISITRIDKYLQAPEIVRNAVEESCNIHFENACVAWPSDEIKSNNERYVLRDLNIYIPNNKLSIISGRTGTGKSLILASILGETEIISGAVRVPRAPKERRDHLATSNDWIIPSAIAYVAQIPWIENASIRDNVTFGLPLDDTRYQKVLEACALKQDLSLLTDGDKTEIGANGINLSGGQRWRLSLARAFYSRAGILILDDIFSAVDANVGRYIFEHGLMGDVGSGRTRILATHHVGLCKVKADYMVELGDGTVKTCELVRELDQPKGLERILSDEETKPFSVEMVGNERAKVFTGVANDTTGEHIKSTGLRNKSSAHKSTPKKFVEQEVRERGKVKGSVYLEFWSSYGGTFYWAWVILIYAFDRSIILGRSWWLKVWTASDSKNDTNDFHMSKLPQVFLFFTSNSATSGTSQNENTNYYFSIYVAISFTLLIVGTSKWWFLCLGSVNASKMVFDRFTDTILHTPLRWIDTVPIGRISNRFSADFNIVDDRLVYDLIFTALWAFKVIGIVVAATLISPYILLFAAATIWFCAEIARYYVVGAREMNRLESTSKSLIFTQFDAALTGIATIRAFDKTEAYRERFHKCNDDYTSTLWYLWLFNRWLGWRMNVVGGLFSTIVSAAIVMIPNTSAGLAGFALAFALDYTPTAISFITRYTNLELDMNSAERIIEYSRLPTETREGADPPAAWPSDGCLEINNLIVGYADDLPPVLKKLTFYIGGNQRIGVVGRTGAGKSSLTLALFRFLEAREGSIHIDGVDISTIKLQALRSRLAIIPQDPVLFSGTVRSNLDAFDNHTDAELQDALGRVHLVSSSQTSSDTSSKTPPTSQHHNQNTNPFFSLLSPVSEGGLNLSQGQRQLLCLARAIVSRPKIMVLDEATSAVDMATDALIQRSIREEFRNSTLIVIAHRLSTIADFDKILVLEEGRAREFGTPRDLLTKEEERGEDRNLGGSFRGMVRESGERKRLEEVILGGGADEGVVG